MIEVPVLKAWNRIFELVKCVGDNPYDRDKLREDVLALFPREKSEKSVFRGMAIPTLRRLGLIIGYNDLIRLSANGKLIYEADKKDRALGRRVLATITYEIDFESVGFLKHLQTRASWTTGEFIDSVRPNIDTLSNSSARERILDWVGLLRYAGLVGMRGKGLSLVKVSYTRALNDADYLRKKALFAKLIRQVYIRLVERSRGMQSQPIEELRAEMAIEMLDRQRRILTERQFDALLLLFPKTDPNYLIAFGRPMGADEKLFQVGDKFYQTISFRFFDK